MQYNPNRSIPGLSFQFYWQFLLCTTTILAENIEEYHVVQLTYAIVKGELQTVQTDYKSRSDLEVHYEINISGNRITIEPIIIHQNYPDTVLFQVVTELQVVRF